MIKIYLPKLVALFDTDCISVEFFIVVFFSLLQRKHLSRQGNLQSGNGERALITSLIIAQ